MGNPVPPARLCPVFVKPFKLSSNNRSKISAALGLPDLPPLMEQAIEEAIAVYKMQSGLSSVTVMENVAAIDEALSAADEFEKTLRRFTDARHSGVGRKTVHALNPSACEVRASIRKFRIEAQARKEELRQYKRFGAEHGPLSELCYWVRFFFEIVQEVREAKPKKKLLRDFALLVFETAGISHNDYYNHPSRMDKLFSQEIPDDQRTQSFAAQLRQEIAYFSPKSQQS